MGIFGWIFYIILGIIFFFILGFISNSYSITKLEKMVFSIILLMITSGLCFRLGIPYTTDIFLVFVFLLIVDIIYQSYYLEKDFFDRGESNVKYYLVLIFLGLFINYEFINEVSSVFLTGEDLRIVLWFLVFIFIYKFCQNNNIFVSKDVTNKRMSSEAVLVNYAKLRYLYHDDCNYDNKDLVNLLYSIMIYNNSKRSKLLRKFDYFMFRLNGSSRPLGIMQVESKKFITDSESIDIVYKKLVKLSEKKNSKTKVNINDVIKAYSKDKAEDIQYIFDIVSKF